jgi:hypothetical protein
MEGGQMQFKPDKAKPISEGVRNLGVHFVQALLREGHDYDSAKSHFLALIASEAIGVANRKLAGNAKVVYGPSSRVRVLGSVKEASRMLGITRVRFAQLLSGAEEMAAR